MSTIYLSYENKPLKSTVIQGQKIGRQMDRFWPLVQFSRESYLLFEGLTSRICQDWILHLKKGLK